MPALLRFGIVFTIALGLTYAIHAFLLINLYESYQVHPLWTYYLVNYTLGLATVILMLLLAKKNGQILGFAFLGSSFVKFIVFFVFFYSSIREIEGAARKEFISFFIPYAIAMIIEVWFLIRYLNRLEEPPKSLSAK